MLVYIPRMKLFLKAEEGTGDNLLDEDINDGYVDYIYIETYVWNGDKFVEDDGGEMLLTEMFKVKYSDDIYGDRMIQDAIEFMFDSRDYDYFVIQEKGE